MNRTALLQMLAAHPDGVGEQQLMRRFGCSRTAIFTAVEALRQDEGLGIDQADTVFRLSDPGGWGPATLSWRAGRPVDWWAECSSTNKLARERLAGLPPGTPVAQLPVVVADHQTQGRGRRGRVWQAQLGANLLFSVVLRPPTLPSDAPRAVLAWAAAMAEVLDVGLKWPNDLVVRDGHRMQKLGGLLAELDTTTHGTAGTARTHTIILGVGINVNQQQFEGLPDATSLARLGRRVDDRAALLGRLVRAIDRVDLTAPGILDRWRERAVMLGEEVVVGEVRGVATGLRSDGALIVGGQAVLAGDVELVQDG